MTVSDHRVESEIEALRISIGKKLERLQVGSSFGLEVFVDENTVLGFEVTTKDSEVQISNLSGKASFYVKLSADSFLSARSGDVTLATLLTEGEIKVRGDISQIDNFQSLLIS